MQWHDPETTGLETKADMLDALFRIKGRFLAVDYQYSLAEAITRFLPWFLSEGGGVHPIQVAPTAHGWSPPRGEDGAPWQLSKRTRLMLRIPLHRESEIASLCGAVLDVEPDGIELGEFKIRRLVPADPLFSRHIASLPDIDEPSFVDWLMSSLEPLRITPRKVVCGKWRTITTPDKIINTRSVLVASLDTQGSVRLQCAGLGEGRTLGCGLFVPHKGIEPVGNSGNQD